MDFIAEYALSLQVNWKYEIILGKRLLPSLLTQNPHE